MSWLLISIPGSFPQELDLWHIPRSRSCPGQEHAPRRAESRQRATARPPGAWQGSLILDIVCSLALSTLLRGDRAFLLLRCSTFCDYDVHICHRTLVRTDAVSRKEFMYSHAPSTSRSPLGILSPCPLTVAAVTNYYEHRG